MRELAHLFSPRSVAVVGATGTPGKLGHLVAQRLAAAFAGDLYFVHPTESELFGRPVHPDLGAVPGPLDLVIALVPGERLMPVIEACPAGHVRFLVTIPAGFGEVSAAGKRLEQQLVALARARGMRLIGPNTAGLLNCVLGLNASLIPDLPPGGPGLSLLTQSGGLGMSLALYAQDHQLPVAKFCDLGNTADLQAIDVLRHWRDDPESRVVGLLLESVPADPALETAMIELARTKPVIVTPLAHTPAGRRASLVHLGLEPGFPRSALAAATAHAIHARTSTDLFDIAKGLTFQPLPRGRRAAILTGSGGVGSELADLAATEGLAVPEAPPAVQAEVAQHMPSYAGARNPIDPTPIWWDYPRVYPAVIKALLRSDAFDLALVGVLDVAATVEPLIDALAELARDPDFQALGKPVYIFWNALDCLHPNMRRLEAAGLPCYRTAERTARTAAAIAAYGEARATVRPAPAELVSAE